MSYLYFYSYSYFYSYFYFYFYFYFFSPRCSSARLSGRALRKAPFLALALHSRKRGVLGTREYLQALSKVGQ